MDSKRFWTKKFTESWAAVGKSQLICMVSELSNLGALSRCGGKIQTFFSFPHEVGERAYNALVQYRRTYAIIHFYLKQMGLVIKGQPKDGRRTRPDLRVRSPPVRDSVDPKSLHEGASGKNRGCN